ncbi:MAG: hypothetical protein AB8F95_13220 [Bacteroidia bacterium]
MKRYSLILVFTWISASILFSQTNSSKACTPDIQYDNPDEQYAFEQAEAGAFDINHFFKAWGDEGFMANKVADKVTSIRTSKYEKRPPAKQLDMLVEGVHQAFLSKYEDRCDWDDLVEKGGYNCMTASLLYAKVLGDNGFTYKIIEEPEHVYIAVEIDGELSVLETTNAASPVQDFSKQEQVAFLDYLEQTKMISTEERQSSSDKVLFERYYFESGELSLEELCGWYYVNQAVFAIENEDYPLAIIHLKKASQLTPSPKVQYLKTALLQEYLNTLTHLDPEFWRFIGDYYCDNPSAAVSQSFTAAAYNVYSYYLTKEPNPAAADSAYQDHQARFGGMDVWKEMELKYIGEKAYAEILQDNYVEAIPWLYKARKWKPDNLVLKKEYEEVVIKALSQKFNQPGSPVETILETYEEEMTGKYSTSNTRYFYHAFSMSAIAQSVIDEATEKQLLEMTGHMAMAYGQQATSPFVENKQMIGLLQDAVLDEEADEALINSIMAYADTFPWLKEDGQFQSIQYMALIDQAKSAFYDNKLSEGKAYVEKIESLMEANNDHGVTTELGESLYWKYALCYINKDQYSKAIEVLNRGLNFFPENEFLKKKIALVGRL